MPYEITLEMTPVGIAHNSVRPGEQVVVRVMDFVSEEDGDRLIDQLEGFVNDLLSRVPTEKPVFPHEVRHLLAIIRRDKTATVYLNELQTRSRVQSKRALKGGEAVFYDDIADIQRVVVDGVTVPKDAGVLYYFFVGWRRAVFFDFLPLSQNPVQDREYDFELQLGSLYTYLMFQRRNKISSKSWANLFTGQWFPFISLKVSTVRKLVDHAANDWPLDELTDAIAREAKSEVPTMLTRWRASKTFEAHMPLLEKAAEHYLNDDHMSAAAILYPRIEGLLRSQQQAVDPSSRASQKGLSGSATKIAEEVRNMYTPLLPAKFREYLETVYFAAFDPQDPHIKISRNSVGHGVASAGEYSQKAATIGMLLVDQLCFCFVVPESEGA